VLMRAWVAAWSLCAPGLAIISRGIPVGLAEVPGKWMQAVVPGFVYTEGTFVSSCCDVLPQLVDAQASRSVHGKQQVCVRCTAPSQPRA